MRRFNPSWAALAVSGVALFTALGGPAWATGLISGTISGSQIKNGSITSVKIGKGQVKNANLATGAVTGSKVARGSLTAGDVAPNTFLAAHGTAANAAELGGVPASGYLTANGTAANSNQLGGVPASNFVQGMGNLVSHRVDIPAGGPTTELVDVGLGEIDGTCSASAHPTVSFTAEAQPLNFVESGFTSGSLPDFNQQNNMTIGQTYTELNPSGLPQSLQFQVGQASASVNRVATAWITDQDLLGTDCIFLSQGLTTGV